MKVSAKSIAQLILSGFSKHYTLFQAFTKQAARHFADANWQKMQVIASERISFYDQRVNECIDEIKLQLADGELDHSLWLSVKQCYSEFLTFHPQADLAETFYNSVFCRLFHRRYFNNDHIFVESMLKQPPVPVAEEYHSYFPVINGLIPTIHEIIEDFGFEQTFIDLARDIQHLVKAFIRQSQTVKHAPHLLRFDILKSPFYRSKAAYIVGRVVTPSGVQPFIIAILHKPGKGLYIDALLTNSVQMRVIFGFARAYFMVNTRSPAGLVRFLNQLMPTKTPAELYNAIGFHKQGKNEFYRELLSHLKNSDDLFSVAKGTPGLVMEVFTLPSFPYVFKIIKDKFGDGKPFGRKTVLERYQLVKKHDKVGRMADTMEYSHVALPLERFSEELITRLKRTIGSSLIFEGDMLIIKHLYIERRMIPLNLYLADASDADKENLMIEYGQALKEMISANIFPGDMLLKNFGVTKHQRVIFYDYDEVQYLSAMNFRKLPSSYYDYGEPVSCAPQDVFIEQLTTFVTPDPILKALLLKHHPELVDVSFWQQQQALIADGVIADLYPYPQSLRFKLYEN